MSIHEFYRRYFAEEGHSSIQAMCHFIALGVFVTLFPLPLRVGRGIAHLFAMRLAEMKGDAAYRKRRQKIEIRERL